MQNLFFFSGSITSFFIILLLGKKHKAIYDWFLIAFFSVILSHIIIFYLTTNNRYSPLLELSSAIVFLSGPILWLYTKTLFSKKLSWKDVLHFLPFFANIFVITPFLFQKTLVPLSELARLFLTWMKLGSILAYCLWSIININRNLKFAKDHFSSVESQHIEWLKMALKLLLSVWFIGTLNQLIFQVNFFEIDPANEDIIINIMVSLIVIFMGYYGFRQAPVFLNTAISSFDQKAENIPIGITGKYQNSSLNEEMIKYYAGLLENLMSSKKPYEDPDLNLSKLALELNLNSNQLSQVINQFYGKNFYEFVNSYRIEEVKRRLEKGDGNQTTLLGIAFDAGFNSKATFNRFFKKYIGKTPSEYLKSLKNQSEL